jgi:hypothetical protein
MHRSPVYVAVMAVLALLAGGCKSLSVPIFTAAPAVRTTVPVIKPCVTDAEVDAVVGGPTVPETSMPPRGSPFEQRGEGAFADAAQYRLWTIEYHRMLKACAQAAPAAQEAAATLQQSPRSK